MSRTDHRRVLPSNLAVRMPQPLSDISDRIELLRMTLGMFAPSEPAPVAAELVQLGEEILEHALLHSGVAPPASAGGGARLTALHTACEQADTEFARIGESCQRLLASSGQVMNAPDDPDAGSHLIAAADSAAELYSFVAARIGGPRPSGASG